MEERCSRQGVADVSAGTVKASLRSHCTVAFARGRRAREGRWGEGRGGKRGKAQLGSSSFIGDRESRDKELKICFANSELDAPQRTKPPGWPLLRAPGGLVGTFSRVAWVYLVEGERMGRGWRGSLASQ
jgi:hypothetical protein